MNHGFEVKVNDEQPVRAGVESDKYSVGCILSATRPQGYPDEQLTINICGYDSGSDLFLEWLKADLAPGDTIQITVINGDYAPPRNSRPQFNAEDIIKDKLKHYHALKEELKEYLVFGRVIV